jgi:phage shock protein A
MGFLDRFSRVVRANVNSWVAKTEDPEKILEQAVLEMQEQLIQLRQAVAGAIASLKRTERQAETSNANAEEWYRRAQLAIQQTNEPLAREALVKRKSYQDTATALFQQLQQQNTVVTKLKQDMRSLELKIAELKSKRDMYIARIRSAEASARLQEILGDVSGATSTGVFERVEDKLLQLESQNEVLSLNSEDNLQKQFTALAANQEVDSELAAMKQQLSHGIETPKSQLPESPNNSQP